MVTTVCLVDDISKAVLEAYRILSHGGFLIIGFGDRSNMVGQTIPPDLMNQALTTFQVAGHDGRKIFECSELMYFFEKTMVLTSIVEHERVHDRCKNSSMEFR